MLFLFADLVYRRARPLVISWLVSLNWCIYSLVLSFDIELETLFFFVETCQDVLVLFHRLDRM